MPRVRPRLSIVRVPIRQAVTIMLRALLPAWCGALGALERAGPGRAVRETHPATIDFDGDLDLAEAVEARCKGTQSV